MRRFCLLLPCLGLLALAARAGEEPAPDPTALFAKGEALLESADFEGALASFVAAARAAPENAAWAERARVVARVISVRKAVVDGEASPHWERMVVSLHAFYLRNGLVGEAEALDRKAHAKLASALSAALFAETLLEAGKDAEALALLDALPAEQMTPLNRIFRGIALAHLARKEEAAKAAEGGSPAMSATTTELYQAARLHALLGRVDDCVGLLRRCLENAPAAVGKAVRESVTAGADFAQVREAPAFVEALKTNPKAGESPCSGGADCGSCPARSGCGK